MTPVEKALAEIKKLAEIPDNPKPPAYVEVIDKKTCSRCRLDKNLAYFWNMKNQKDGKDYYCKVCRSNGSIKSHGSNSVKCTLQDCNRPHWGNGFCRLHYERVQRTGSPYRKTKIRDRHDLHRLNIILSRYNVDSDWYFEHGKDGCQVCGDQESMLHVDHDHDCCPDSGSCGKCVRGVVCASCNVHLRHFDKGTIRQNNYMIPQLEEYINEYKSRG